MQTVILSEFYRIVKKVSKESKGKLSLVHIGENHGTCENTGMQHEEKQSTDDDCAGKRSLWEDSLIHQRFWWCGWNQSQYSKLTLEIVHTDIEKFFDNVNQDKLMKLVEQRMLDRRILKLIRQWLALGVL